MIVKEPTRSYSSTFLIELLKQSPVEYGTFLLPESDISTFDPANLHPLSVMLQAGYLTIHSFERRGTRGRYRLAFPNREVEDSFATWLAC